MYYGKFKTKLTKSNINNFITILENKNIDYIVYDCDWEYCKYLEININPYRIFSISVCESDKTFKTISNKEFTQILEAIENFNLILDE
jgi:hypothetical protein